MNVRVITLFFLLFSSVLSAQISAYKYGLFAKEFSKDIALYRAKEFVMNDVLGESTGDVVKFQIDALAASNSGELTTLSYKCESKNKEGLVLGFYGSRWNDAGVIYTSFGFKNLPYNDAVNLISKIENAIDENSKYLDDNHDNNNLYLKIDDITVLIYQQFTDVKIRVFWNGFDAEWMQTEFAKTKRRMLRKLK